MKPIKHPKKFAHDLCDWYRLNMRDLPFRKTKDPYAIMVSELMLQQTQMDTVIPYYERFIKQFPDVYTLANADIRDVLKTWEGLGYYRRARYLHDSANMIVNEHQGVFPSTLEELRKLKGLGAYTAGAIHAIAFNQPTPAVDGNVLRVISRITVDSRDIAEQRTVKAVEQLVGTLIVHEQPSDFTQALMEIGALVCKVKPQCAVCPLQTHCHAYQTMTQENFPIKSKKAAKTTEPHIVLVVTSKDDTLLFQKRPEHGLLGGLLELPQYATTSLEEAVSAFENTYNVTINTTTYLFQINHVFTHKVWNMSVYDVKISQPNMLTFHHPEHLPEALSKAHRKILTKLKSKATPSPVT